MTSHDSAADDGAEARALGQLTQRLTADGSLSLFSSAFNEDFHSSAGALAEAKAKFVAPAELSRFGQGKPLRVLDVCVGLGHNSAALMQALPDDSHPALQWWGLELDRRPLQLALAHDGFQNLWLPVVRERLQSLLGADGWEDSLSKGTILWGDARRQLQALPVDLRLDLILLDAFSPGCCPQLWSEEFLKALARRLAPGGRLLTYCRAAAVRASLQRAGLTIRSLLPAPGQRREWSSGTLACCENGHGHDPLAHSGPGWVALSTMENEHLLTRAAVPYRDPDGTDDAEHLQQRRREEQQGCGLESTSSWQRRWLHERVRSG